MASLGLLKWDIGHDPCKVGDRSPLGAVTMGTAVRLRLRVGPASHSRIASVEALVCEGDGEWSTVMEPEADGFACTVGFRCESHVAFYRFAITLDTGEVIVYAPRLDGRSTAGELHDPDTAPRGFQVSVYEPYFATPDWFAGAVMYQAFPDRFARGGGGVRVEGIERHEQAGRPVHLREEWETPLSWEEGREYDPVEFYGGTLEGIREKLPYLASLGVEALYLNPVFEARSNHRYDTADYEHIDPLLGTDEQFAQLAEEAAGLGISIILDAVLSHTGSDSRYFNAKGAYEGPGAAQGPESPYYSWYDFSSEGEGLPYRCWWGDSTLPEVDERNESWQRYILGEILPKWLAAGARGFRLDVADEVPDDVLERIRSAVKSTNPQAVIIGEVWEDATTKESYGASRTYALGRSLDSVMNYPLRDALIGFATNAIDAYQLATFLKLQQSNYPTPMHRCLMNLLSSHDVERIRTVLAYGKPIRNRTREEQFQIQCGLSPEDDSNAARLQAMLSGLLYVLPGSPCIYYGDERGMQGGSDPFCRAPMAWDDAIRPDVGMGLADHYRNLGAIRKKSNALRDGSLACLAVNPDVLVVVRVPGDDQPVLAICNRSSDAQRIVIDFEELGVSALNGKKLEFGGANAHIECGLAVVGAPAMSTTLCTVC